MEASILGIFMKNYEEIVKGLGPVINSRLRLVSVVREYYRQITGRPSLHQMISTWYADELMRSRDVGLFMDALHWAIGRSEINSPDIDIYNLFYKHSSEIRIAKAHNASSAAPIRK